MDEMTREVALAMGQMQLDLIALRLENAKLRAEVERLKGGAK